MTRTGGDGTSNLGDLMEDEGCIREAVEEVDFPSKRRTTDAANDCSQNCPEERTSRPIQITGSPQT
jgi:hypothetical protein